VARRLMRMRRDGLVRREVGADGQPRWYAAEAWS
jgi:DNA-binding HxlR family transcriptional regulator